MVLHFFIATYGVKYDKAVGKLTKDREVLLALYDFPAEHWKHIRTTNPIESTFATVRHRTGKTKAPHASQILQTDKSAIGLTANAPWNVPAI